MKLLKTFIAGSILLSSIAHADKPFWLIHEMPFKQALDMNTVYGVTNSTPDTLLETINKYGVHVLVVKTKDPIKKINPLFAKLDVAGADLIKRAEFQESYEGRMIAKANPCCSVERDTILIRDTALSYTLIHEFLHSALQAKGLLESSVVDKTGQGVEEKFAGAFRRLSFYQKKLYGDPTLLLNPLWRKDLLNANQDVVELLFERIQIGQSQEAIIEKVLASYIDKKNPFYDRERQEQGIKYGEVMINNAIDIFNEVDQSLNWSRNTVQGLSEAIASGDIDQKEAKNLSAKDAKLFALAIETKLKALEPVKNEILNIKAFYTK